MKIVTVLGARPQFIKAAPVSRRLAQTGHTEILVHTGQHYDHEMSQVFFDELGIAPPSFNLGVGSGSHAWQTSAMMTGIEEILLREKPECVVVYGDTNSTLAGALVAAKLNLELAHVEAGLRSFNRSMPEEVNRIVADRCSTILFCPTLTAVRNLEREGIHSGVHLVGDTMFDAVLQFEAIARRASTVLDRLNLRPGEFLLVTLHRPYNTDVPENLRNILDALHDLEETVVFPVHPRTRSKIAELQLSPRAAPSVLWTDPVGYLDMLVLQANARIVLTDSGGMQKETYFLGTPCITLRPETEWVETVEAGWNILAGADRQRIVDLVREHRRPSGPRPEVFGDGRSAEKIVGILAS